MALDVDGSTQYLSYAGAPVTAVPLTMMAWVWRDTFTTQDNVFSIGSSTTTAIFSLLINTTDEILARSASVLEAVDDAATSTTITATGWNHCCARFETTTARSALLNGGGKGTNASLNVPLLLNRTFIGANANTNGPNNYHDGKIAFVSLHNVALTDADVLDASKGLHPGYIHPEALVALWELYGNSSPEPDFFGNYPMTLNAAPVKYEQPRIWMPRQSFVMKPAALAVKVGAGLTRSLRLERLRIAA